MNLVEQMRLWSHARQCLGQRGMDAEAVLRAIVGVYSAHPSGPLALHARVRDLTATAFTALETERRALRVPAMRSSIYLVPRTDAAWVLAATRTALLEYQYLLRQGRITPERYAEAKAAILHVAQVPLPIVAIRHALAAEDLPLSGILKTMCREGALLRLPGTSLLGNTLRYVATAAWIGRPLAEETVAVAQHRLAAAYLRAFGPVRVTDFAWWAGITATRARAAFALLDLVDVGDGWLLAAEDRDAFTEMATLAPETIDVLPPWDAYTMGYAPDGRARLIAPEHQHACYDAVGNGVGIILVRGEAAATWHARLTHHRLTVQVRPFAVLTTGQADQLTERFTTIGHFVGVPTIVLPTLGSSPSAT